MASCKNNSSFFSILACSIFLPVQAVAAPFPTPLIPSPPKQAQSASNSAAQDRSKESSLNEVRSDKEKNDKLYGEKTNPELKKCLQDADDAISAKEPERALKILNYAQTKFTKDYRPALYAARVYFILGQNDKAIRLLNAQAAKYPLFDAPYAILGNVFLGQGKLQEAKKQYEIAVLLDPHNADACFKLAQIALAMDAREEAIHRLNQALESDPHHQAARVLLARLLWNAGKLDAALLEYNSAIAQDQKNAELLSELAAILATTNKYQEAIEKLIQAYRLNPDSAEIQKQLLSIYGKRRDWPNAQDAAKSWTQLEPKNAKSHLILGWCALQNHEFDEAAQSLKEAVSLAPGDCEAHNIYGMTLLERRRFDDAINQFKAANAINTPYLPALLNLAAAYSMKGQHAEALEQLSGLEIQYPENPALLSLHSFVCTKTGDYSKAERFNKEALAIDPQDTLALTTAGIIYRQKGMLEESQAVLLRASKIATDSALVLCELSRTLLAENKGEQAIEMAQQALQIAPSNLDAKAALALALFHQKNYDGPITLLKECIVRNPKDLNLRMVLAAVQVAKGDNESCQITLEKAHTLFPSAAGPICELAKLAADKHNYRQALEYLEEALVCAPEDQQILIQLARVYYSMGKQEHCLEQLNTVNESTLQSQDILLKARCEYGLKDYSSAAADYAKLVQSSKLLQTDDLMNYARAMLATGQEARAQEFLSKLESDPKLLKQCKQAEIDKLQQSIHYKSR